MLGARAWGFWEKKGQFWREFENQWPKEKYPWTQELWRQPSPEPLPLSGEQISQDQEEVVSFESGALEAGLKGSDS